VLVGTAVAIVIGFLTWLGSTLRPGEGGSDAAAASTSGLHASHNPGVGASADLLSACGTSAACTCRANESDSHGRAGGNGDHHPNPCRRTTTQSIGTQPRSGVP
jgi:hypothetical protein